MKYTLSAHPTELTFTGRAERISHLLRFADVVPAGKVLDVGCGYGDVALGLARVGFQVVGADIFLPGVQAASRASTASSLDAMFLMTPVESLAVKDQAFQLVVCYNIWEHVQNPGALLNQIARVLQKEGVLFLVVPNRFWVMETHYRLPFLSWLPKALANIYVRVARRGTQYDVACPTWWELDRSFKCSGFEVTNLNLYVLRNFNKLYPKPEYLGNIKYRIGSLVSHLLSFLPDSLARLSSNLFSEAFFVVARPKSAERSSLATSGVIDSRPRELKV